MVHRLNRGKWLQRSKVRPLQKPQRVAIQEHDQSLGVVQNAVFEYDFRAAGFFSHFGCEFIFLGSWFQQLNLAWNACLFLLCFTIRILTDKPPLISQCLYSQHHKELPTELWPIFGGNLNIRKFDKFETILTSSIWKLSSYSKNKSFCWWDEKRYSWPH